MKITVHLKDQMDPDTAANAIARKIESMTNKPVSIRIVRTPSPFSR